MIGNCTQCTAGFAGEFCSEGREKPVTGMLTTLCKTTMVTSSTGATPKRTATISTKVAIIRYNHNIDKDENGNRRDDKYYDGFGAVTINAHKQFLLL